MTNLQIFGLIGGAFFAYAAVPQAVKTVRAGKHLGTPLDIMSTILLGLLMMYVYLTATNGFDWVLTVNYSVEAASWGTLLYYRLRKNKGNTK